MNRLFQYVYPTMDQTPLKKDPSVEKIKDQENDEDGLNALHLQYLGVNLESKNNPLPTISNIKNIIKDILNSWFQGWELIAEDKKYIIYGDNEHVIQISIIDNLKQYKPHVDFHLTFELTSKEDEEFYESSDYIIETDYNINKLEKDLYFKENSFIMDELLNSKQNY